MVTDLICEYTSAKFTFTPSSLVKYLDNNRIVFTIENDPSRSEMMPLHHRHKCIVFLDCHAFRPDINAVNTILHNP